MTPDGVEGNGETRRAWDARGVFLHHNYAYLNPGDVVRAGNWGRVLQGYGGQHPLFLRETLWELVRQQDFPEHPSRLTSAFFYEDEDTAKQGMQEGDTRRAPNLYEVELVDDSAAVHRADLHYWERAWLAVHSPSEAQEVARGYWRGDTPSGRLESLTTSDLRVIAVLQRSRPRD